MLNRWARGRDDRQRWVLGAFLFGVFAVTVGDGLREILFRHDAIHDLLSLRTMILRRHGENPFQLVAVVSPAGSISSCAAELSRSASRPCVVAAFDSSSRQRCRSYVSGT
jgi:hypothetical protein